jgi:hypothetical protein
LTLPKPDHFPALFPKRTAYSAIAGSITFDFVEPVRLIGFVFGATTLSPPIPVPEFAIAKDGYSAANENEIGLAENGILFSITKTGCPQRFPQLPFYG